MRRKFVVFAAAVVCAAGAAAGYQAQADPITESPKSDSGDTTADLELIAPTGEFAVGVSWQYLVDSDRPDPWVPEEPRELMVSMWYPTTQDGGEVAPYMTPDESRLFLADNDVDVPPDTLGNIDTHAYLDAKPIRSEGRLPLVVLSPGFSKPRATLTGIAEDLASRGYIVALIGHNYEAVTGFPDGRTTECLACGTGEYAKATKGRAEDVSFVLDELTDKHGPWKGGKLIDTDRIAMCGHSLGGAASYTAMREDDRIKAGLNIDGTIHEPGDVPFDRPLGLIGHDMPELDPSWVDAWELSTGWKRWMEVSGTAHASFTDVGLLLSQLGQPPADIDAERAVSLTRTYVAAFFDQHLRGLDQPILDGPSPAWPEVEFHQR